MTAHRMKSVGLPAQVRARAKICLSLAIISTIVLVDQSYCFGIRKGQFGSACDENDPNGCDSKSALSCLASICDCLYPWMMYDTNRTKCVSTVNQPCDPNTGEGAFIECVTNAECKFSPNEYRQQFPSCSCQTNYIPSLKLRCDDPPYSGSGRTDLPNKDQQPQICCPGS